MRQVEEWAKRPFEGEELYMVGSAYHPYRGYIEGALVSANNALLEGWGIPIPSPPHEACIAKPVNYAVKLDRLIREKAGGFCENDKEKKRGFWRF